MNNKSKILGIAAFAILGVLLLSVMLVQSVSAVETAADTAPMTTGTVVADNTTCPNEANAHDADGDGIPNCLDEDWTPPMDGTGYQMHGANGQGMMNGHGNGPHDGTGQQMHRQYRHNYNNGVETP